MAICSSTQEEIPRRCRKEGLLGCLPMESSLGLQIWDESLKRGQALGPTTKLQRMEMLVFKSLRQDGLPCARVVSPGWCPYLWKGEQLTEYTGPPWGEKVNCTGALRGTELGIRVRAAASAAREHLRGKPPSVPRMKRLESKLEKATDVTPTSVSPRGGFFSLVLRGSCCTARAKPLESRSWPAPLPLHSNTLPSVATLRTWKRWLCRGSDSHST